MDEVMKQRESRSAPGFSLIELLAVMGIMVTLLGLATLGISRIIPALDLNRGGQIVSDTISAARQHASTLNREVQVVFVEIPDGSEKHWKAMQLWKVDETPNGQKITSLTPLIKLPAGVVINPEPALSPLLRADSTIEGSKSIGEYENVNYRGFRFRPGGAPDQWVKVNNNFITLNGRNDPSATPKNYYTLQVNPVTGRTAVFRP